MQSSNTPWQTPRGAYPAEWDAWTQTAGRYLLPAIADSYSQAITGSVSDALLQTDKSGVTTRRDSSKIPSRLYAGQGVVHAAGVARWTQEFETLEASHPDRIARRVAEWRFSGEHNILLRTRRFHAIDIDVEDPAIVTKALGIIRAELGVDLPRRVRQGLYWDDLVSPRTALLFEIVDEGDGKTLDKQVLLITPPPMKQVIEVLADNQQVMVAGVHAKTGQRVAWFKGDQRWDYRDIPQITREAFGKLWKRLCAEMPVQGSDVHRYQARDVAKLNWEVPEHAKAAEGIPPPPDPVGEYLLKHVQGTRQIRGERKISVRCPWGHEHTTGGGDSDTSTVWLSPYWVTGEGETRVKPGLFYCSHSCKTRPERKGAMALRALGVPDDIGAVEHSTLLQQSLPMFCGVPRPVSNDWADAPAFPPAVISLALFPCVPRVVAVGEHLQVAPGGLPGVVLPAFAIAPTPPQAVVPYVQQPLAVLPSDTELGVLAMVPVRTDNSGGGRLALRPSDAARNARVSDVSEMLLRRYFLQEGKRLAEEEPRYFKALRDPATADTAIAPVTESPSHADSAPVGDMLGIIAQIIQSWVNRSMLPVGAHKPVKGADGRTVLSNNGPAYAAILQQLVVGNPFSDAVQLPFRLGVFETDSVPYLLAEGVPRSDGISHQWPTFRVAITKTLAMLLMSRLYALLESPADGRSADTLCSAWAAIAKGFPVSLRALRVASCQWDGEKRLDTLPSRVFHAVEDNEYTRRAIRYMFTTAVARAIFPGAKADGAVVLVCRPGVGKSLLVSSMALHEDDATSMPMPNNIRDALAVLSSKAIVELPELMGLRPNVDSRGFGETGQAIAKVLLGGAAHSTVQKYEAAASTKRYTAALIGTINRDAAQFIEDWAGMRRWFPVELDVPAGQFLNSPLMRDIARQCWAEALAELMASVPAGEGLQERYVSRVLGNEYNALRTLAAPYALSCVAFTPTACVMGAAMLQAIRAGETLRFDLDQLANRSAISNEVTRAIRGAYDRAAFTQRVYHQARLYVMAHYPHDAWTLVPDSTTQLDMTVAHAAGHRPAVSMRSAANMRQEAQGLSTAEQALPPSLQPLAGFTGVTAPKGPPVPEAPPASLGVPVMGSSLRH